MRRRRARPAAGARGGFAALALDGFAALALGGLVALALAAAALAYVPPADRIARTVAEANRVHGRARPLALEVAVRGPGDAPLAKGTLLSTPAGAARLELAHTEGFVERQLRRGRDLGASRDRASLEDPYPLLPPLWVLQAGDGAALQTRIGELGGDPDAVALGFDGDHDCYVLGGRSAGASYWVDQESLAPVRIDLPGGVRYRLGPLRTQGGVQLPAWVTLETPGRPPVRLAIEGVRADAVPADAFASDWLAR